MNDNEEDVFPAPEPYQIPKDRSKIKQRIRRYERSLEQEKIRLGGYGDGSGKRFLLGPLYMILGDMEGALESFAWFETEFPDSLDEAPQLLCWSLALHQTGDDYEARRMLRRTMFANLYIIPRLLSMQVRRHDIWHDSNTAEPSYLGWVPEEYWGLWSESDRQWAAGLWRSTEFRESREQYVELGHALKSLRPGPERNRVLVEVRRLRTNDSRGRRW